MKLRFAIGIAALLLLGQGCAALKFEIPGEFRGKKQVEDPPLSRLPHQGAAPCA